MSRCLQFSSDVFRQHQEESSPSCESTDTEATNENPSRISAKSREKYIQCYNNFIEWKKSKKVESFSESVFLDYFKELAEDRQPATLWSTYSMLKPTVSTEKNIDMKTYTKLIAYITEMAKGHKSKKSNVFTNEEVKTFLNEAPDKHYLLSKVALIFGIEGACRGKELIKITVKHIKNTPDGLFVKLKDAKTNKDKSFTIRKEYKSIVEKYQALRPEDIETKRFFIQYRNGKCMKQVIGKNRFSVLAQEIACYLKLPDVMFYTGHCFRRTSASLVTNDEVGRSSKEPEEEKSGTVAEEKSKDSMEKIVENMSCENENDNLGPSGNLPTSALSPRPSTSKYEPPPSLQNESDCNELDSNIRKL